MLDKRDIQTLMYCVRWPRATGSGSGRPPRSPNDLECKLAQLLRQSTGAWVVQRRLTQRAPGYGAAFAKRRKRARPPCT